MTRTIATLVVKKYEGLLRKVAYRCGIHQQHPNFDDYLQEGRWHLFQLASAFEDLASFEQTYSLSFLYQNLYWFFLDFQRKQHERYHQKQRRTKCLNGRLLLQNFMPN